jgi:hypothetical protein
MSTGKATKALVTKINQGGTLTKAEKDQAIKATYGDSEALVKDFKGNEEAIDTWWQLMNSPEMRERAMQLQKAGKIKQGIEGAVDAFNKSYDLYLATEQKRVGEQELAAVQQVQKPGKVEAIPELEDAIRRARELGDPTAAISQLEQGIERSNLGAVRAAQLGSRGQAGALGAQGQAIHQANLAAQGQIPMMAQQIKGQGLQALTPLIAQKQAIEQANRQAEIATFGPRLRNQQLQEMAAGQAIAGGTMGQRGSIQGLMGQVPEMAGNLYSQQYAHLPPEVAPYVGGLDWGLNR